MASSLAGVPGSFSNFPGRTSARIVDAFGQSGTLDSVFGYLGRYVFLPISSRGRTPSVLR